MEKKNNNMNKKIDKDFKQYDKYFKTEKTIFEEKNENKENEIIKPGINIIGKCLNKECKNFEKLILLKNSKEKMSICYELNNYSTIKCEYCKNIINSNTVSLFQCNFHVTIYDLNGNKLSYKDKVNKNNVFSFIFIIKNIHHVFKEFFITTNEKGYHIYLSDIEELEQNLKNLEIKNDDDKKFYNWLIKEKENKEFLYNVNINEIVNQINNYTGTYINPRDIELVYLNDSEKQKERLAKIDEIIEIILEKEMTFKNYCEYIIKLGNEIKNDIIYRIYHSPQQFYSKYELSQITENSPLFIQGVLKEYLNNLGILTVIEKNPSKKFKFYKVMNHLINSGDIYDNILTIKYNLDLKKEILVLTNQAEQKIFIEEKRKILSNLLNIEENNISISNIRKGCLQIDVRINQDINQGRINQLRSGDYEIRECLTKTLLNSCQISSENFDIRGNRKRGWGINEKRGPPNHLKNYDPPNGYDGYGLNVLGKYDNSNNDWLNYKNVEGEWYIAYHGTKGTQAEANGNTTGIINNIINNGLRRGPHQVHNTALNINPLSNHEFNICGDGVYLSPLIRIATGYSQSGVRFNGQNYYLVFMCRVNPKKVRISNRNNNYWIVSGEPINSNSLNRHDDEIRPYRILLKKITN